MLCEAKVAAANISISLEDNKATTRTIIDCRLCPYHQVFDTTGDADMIFTQAADAVSDHLPEGCIPPKKYQ